VKLQLIEYSATISNFPRIRDSGKLFQRLDKIIEEVLRR